MGEKQRILSGDNSETMWDLINSIPKRKTRMAVYVLACKCQELEAVVERQAKQLEAIMALATKKEQAANVRATISDSCQQT